jgi:serine/threonine protein kinase
MEKRYLIKEILGKGSYGSVYKGVCRKTNRMVALKI